MSEPLTAEELATALHGANDDGSAESDDYRFPYIDAEHADVIDGGLSILCRWLVARFDVTPRAARKPRRRVIGSDGASRPERGQP